MLGLGKPAVADLERLLFRTPSKSPADLAHCIASTLGISETAARSHCETLWNAQLTEAYTLPGAIEAVAKLDAAGIQRAYLSNIWPPFYEHFRRTFASEAEAPQFLSFEMGVSKPDKEFFRQALDRLNVEPSEVVMIGDTYKNDILPAIELGMRTVWVLHRPDKERAALVDVLNGTSPKPHHTLNSITDLTLEHLS
jgi:HAD superfamily hydrolase (TIGR01549 family)